MNSYMYTNTHPYTHKKTEDENLETDLADGYSSQMTAHRQPGHCDSNSFVGSTACCNSPKRPILSSHCLGSLNRPAIYKNPLPFIRMKWFYT